MMKRYYWKELIYPPLKHMKVPEEGFNGQRSFSAVN